MEPTTHERAQERPQECLIVENLRVRPRIKALNRFAQKVNKVAISAIDPVYADNNQLLAFNICVEGPPGHVSYFNRLIASADLKVS